MRVIVSTSESASIVSVMSERGGILNYRSEYV